MGKPLGQEESAGGRSVVLRGVMDRIRGVFIETLHLNIREEDLPYEQKLDEVVGLDSLAVLEFVTAVEKEFGVTMDPEFLTLDFVRDLPQFASYIQDLAGDAPASAPDV